ncbi:hypothetical protein HKX48_005339 [Thoreauomyces humboldtii]|nr:hypothetical protein HKX48_005339 [Thoreauomyces humboldtii]
MQGIAVAVTAPLEKRPPQACDGCRSKKRKCDGAQPVCGQCRKARYQKADGPRCTYYLTIKKRGPPPGSGGRPSKGAPPCAVAPQGPFPISSGFGEAYFPQDYSSGESSGSSPNPSLGHFDVNSNLADDPSAAGPASDMAGPTRDDLRSHAEGSMDFGTHDPFGSSTAESDLDDLLALVSSGTPPSNETLNFHFDPALFDPSGTSDAGFSVAFDPAMYQNMYMGSSFEPFIRQTSIFGQGLPDLLIHLTQLGQSLDMSYDALGIKPGNLEPSAVQVLAAQGAAISAHPGLNQQYGSRRAAVRLFAAKADALLSIKPASTASSILSMLRLGAIYYGLMDNASAARWIGEACTRCQQLGYHRTTVTAFPTTTSLFERTVFSPEIPEARMQLVRTNFELERDSQWHVYTTAIEYDTLAAMASLFNTWISDAEIPAHMMYARRPWETSDEIYAERVTRDQNSYHVLDCKSPNVFEMFPHPFTRDDSGPSLFVADPGRAGAYVIQACMLQRRAMRYIRTRSDSFKGPSYAPNDSAGATAGFVLQLNPAEPNLMQLHEALIGWWAALPIIVRPFENLTQFLQPCRDSTADTHGLMFLVVMQLTTLCLLHWHEVQGGRNLSHLYRLDPQSEHQVTSLQILTLARRALAHCLRCYFSGPLTPSSISEAPPFGEREPCYSHLHPALHPHLIASPRLGFDLALIVNSEVHGLLIQRAERCPFTYAEAIHDSETLFLPVLDTIGRLRRVDREHAQLVRKAFAADGTTTAVKMYVGAVPVDVAPLEGLASLHKTRATRM